MSEIPEGVNHLSGRVIGAAIDVHRALGPGFLENVYEEALCIELRHLAIPFARQAAVEVGYRGQPVGESRLDLIVGGQIVVELKAVENLLPLHLAQLNSYLKATGSPLGLLINFNVKHLTDGGLKRVIRAWPEGPRPPDHPLETLRGS